MHLHEFHDVFLLNIGVIGLQVLQAIHLLFPRQSASSNSILSNLSCIRSPDLFHDGCFWSTWQNILKSFWEAAMTLFTPWCASAQGPPLLSLRKDPLRGLAKHAKQLLSLCGFAQSCQSTLHCFLCRCFCCSWTTSPQPSNSYLVCQDDLLKPMGHIFLHPIDDVLISVKVRVGELWGKHVQHYKPSPWWFLRPRQ